MYKKIGKLKEKATNQLEETLKYEEKNNWNRLPVVDQYSHQPIDKTMYQIWRHLSREDYEKILNMLKKGKNMFMKLKIGGVSGGNFG